MQGAKVQQVVIYKDLANYQERDYRLPKLTEVLEMTLRDEVI